MKTAWKKTNNRFDLVLLASKRARQLSRGSLPLLDEEDDKPTVLALREIAAGKVTEAFFEEETEEESFEDSHFYTSTEQEENLEAKAKAKAEAEAKRVDESESVQDEVVDLPDEESAEIKFMEEMERNLAQSDGEDPSPQE